MGRQVFAEDHLLLSLKTLSKNAGYSFGLILGQSTVQKDYLIHFAPSFLPPAEGDKATPEGGDICSVKELGDYDDSWIATHTRNVIKMLPGGMAVLGVFVTCPDSSSDTIVFNKLRTLAIHSFNSTKNNSFLYLTKNSNRLLLQYSMNSKTYVCKSLDAGSLNASLQHVDMKFTSESFKWYQVDSAVDLVNFSPYLISKNKESCTLKKMLKDMLLVIQSKIESCECSVDKKFVDLADEVRTFKEKEEKKIKEFERLTGKQLNFDFKSIAVQLYDRKLPDEFSFKLDHIEPCAEVVFKGDVRSRIFVIGSTTLEDTVKAVKEDLIRCCSTKFEMHWETNDSSVVPSKNNGRIKEEVHILPRRVLFVVPGSNIQLSEYLFLDESAEDILPSIQENLGFELDQTSILDILETKCDSCIPTNPEESSAKNTSSKSGKNSNNLFIISIVVASLIALIISLLIQFA